jgi:hypothetical protein
MKSIIMTSCCVFSGVFLMHAQSSPDSGGSNASGSSGTVTYSIGQTFYEPVKSLSGSTSPGAQQPYEISETLGQEIAEIGLSLKIYPNPTTDILNLRIDLNDYQKYSYELYDLGGRFLNKKPVAGKVTELSMSKYPSGTYLLKVSKGNTPVKIFKVIKTDK